MSKKGKILVAFRLDEDIAEILDGLPNKSDFIRRAVMSQLGAQCPLCLGRGLVTAGAGAYFGATLEKLRHQSCVHCQVDVDIPGDTQNVAVLDRLRFEQFFHGGPLYCDSCFRSAQQCTECDWRFDEAELARHSQTLHQTVVLSQSR